MRGKTRYVQHILKRDAPYAALAARERRNGPDGYVILNNGSPNPKPRTDDGLVKVVITKTV